MKAAGLCRHVKTGPDSQSCGGAVPNGGPAVQHSRPMGGCRWGGKDTRDGEAQEQEGLCNIDIYVIAVGG